MKNAGGAPKTVNPDSFQTTTENTARDKKSVIEVNIPIDRQLQISWTPLPRCCVDK